MSKRPESALTSGGAVGSGDGDAARRTARLDRLKRTAAAASVAVAAALVLAKAGAWLSTGSVSLLSTMIDSLFDLTASVITVIAVRQAIVPADREHRFGHGKAEPLAGLAQAAFIGGSAAFLLFQAIERLIHPQPIVNSALGFAVMGLSIVLTVALVGFQRIVVRKTGSIAIQADSLHYGIDLLTNLAVIAALAASTRLDWTFADPVFAIGIVLVTCSGVWGILRRSLDTLMDHELPDEQRQRIRAIATSHPRVIAMHDLRTRSSGTQLFIQLHLEMDPRLTLKQAHQIAEEVMAELERAFPGSEVLIHQDPYGVPERRARFD